MQSQRTTPPASVFQMVEDVIRSHTQEQGERHFSSYRYKANNDWEAIPHYSDSLQYLLNNEMAARLILWSLYGKIDKSPLAVTSDDNQTNSTQFEQHATYPAAQLSENLRQLKSAIQKSFKVMEKNVEFSPYLHQPEDFPLQALVEHLIGKNSPSGLQTITGHPQRVISMKNAKIIAPLLELSLEKSPIIGG